ncbi:PfkB family carbohydrate kinase [Streptococcus catagoni]|uniref:PfkB family carbohydrate kinase n=1 Tax=Streptococcus catagoni TaxID=2654874 RepID=UPI00140A0A84|nr:PfkB family carbohydrate kinase [Streptococcus catagoni]
MTKREKEILDIISDNPFISQDQLAKILGISRSAVATHIFNLTNKGLIRGRGYILSQPQFVTIIGGINIDIIGLPNEKIIKNNSNAGQLEFSLGGAAFNIALGLRKLDVQNFLISVYGDDSFSDMFLNHAKQNQLDISCCEQLEGERTSTFLYVENKTEKDYFGIDDMGIYQHMTPTFLKKYITKINQSDYCIIDTNIPAATIDYLKEQVEVPIIAKTVSLSKNLSLIPLLSQLHYLVTTPVELVELISQVTQKACTLEEAIDYLLKHGTENIILLDTENTLSYYSKYHSQSLTIKHHVVSHTGGIASLTAALVFCLINNFELRQTLEYLYSALLLSHDSSFPLHPSFSLKALRNKRKTYFTSK